MVDLFLYGYKVIEIDGEELPPEPIKLGKFVDIIGNKKLAFICPSCGELVERSIISLGLGLLFCPHCGANDVTKDDAVD